jgi:hypothetical protein
MKAFPYGIRQRGNLGQARIVEQPDTVLESQRFARVYLISDMIYGRLKVCG